ncbi:MAG: hypothetical protein H0U23_15055 [Blastocatellia bacterium]|jgi:hypothetical protein|nr:hypothetical protein [Blastocatellia bacterium]
MKPIRLTKHARGYFERRGFTVDEVETAIRSETWQSAEKGRLECAREYEFGRDWNGCRYAWKKVNPIFVEEETEIVVITVYTFYY